MIEILNKARGVIRRLVLIGLPIFAIYNFYYPWSGLRERSLFVLILLAAVYLNTAKEHRGSLRWLVFDSVNLFITLAVFGYTFWNWESILVSAGLLATRDLVFGVFGAYLAIVATWKVVGKPLLVVILLFTLYVFFGQYLPPVLGGHGGYSIQRISNFMLFSENGLMGFIIGVTLKYVLLFLVLGNVLRACGALDFIMDLARVFFRRGGRSGPALMAVFSSGMVGSVMGAAVANVFVTGNVTIPLMKRVGIKPELAGAIEAAASTGGQIMPPVMGFTAFFMVALLGIAYIEVVQAAFIPALLYFLAVGAAVYFRTRGKRLPSDSTWADSTLTLKKVVFRVSTISFLGTLAVLVTLLVMHYSLQLSALYAMSFAVVSSFFGRNRFTPRKVVTTLEDAGKDTIGIGVAALVMGLIAGAILLTGLGGKIPTLLISWSGGNLIPLLFFTMLASLILGIGVPTSIAYLIVAITVSSSLTQLGIPILHAHLFVFYAAMAAMLTPPVALAAYAGATIAQANFWKTGLLAFVLGLPALLVPFAFILRPELVMSGSPLNIIGVTLLSAVGLVCFIAALGIGSKTVFEVLKRVALGIGGILLLLFPIGMYSVVGAGLCLFAGWKVILPLATRIIRAGRQD